MIKLSSDAYVASGGAVCPHCGSDNIEGYGGADFDGNYCTKSVKCHDCDSEWNDVFELVGYSNLVVPK